MERPHSYPFVVLEGIDGTGKSIVSGLVASKIAGVKVSTPMEPYASQRPKFREETWNAEESFDFYLEAVKDASLKILAMCQETPVVCDRYVASTYAYHTGMGLDSALASQKIEQGNLFMPDISYQLDADDEILMQRLTQRGSKPLKKEWLDKIRNAYQLFNYILVDTSNLTAEEVADVIVDSLKENKII